MGNAIDLTAKALRMARYALKKGMYIGKEGEHEIYTVLRKNTNYGVFFKDKKPTEVVINKLRGKTYYDLEASRAREVSYLSGYHSSVETDLKTGAFLSRVDHYPKAGHFAEFKPLENRAAETTKIKEQATLGFQSAKAKGKLIANKNGIEVYEIPKGNGRELVSFKDGKPYRYIQKADQHSTIAYDATTETINELEKFGGHYKRIISKSNGEVKGISSITVDKTDNHIEFLTMQTPDMCYTGIATKDASAEMKEAAKKDPKNRLYYLYDWIDNGFGGGPYTNVKFDLRQFNHKLK